MKRNKNRILVALLIFALFMQFVAAFFYFDYFADAAIGKAIYLVAKVLLIILPLIFYGLFVKDLEKIETNAQTNTRAALLWGLLSGLVIMGIIFAFYWLSPQLVQSVTPDIITKVRELQIEKFFIPFAIFLSIFHSLLEEFYWRWFVFRGLSMKMNYRAAAVISSLAFAGHHFLVLKEMFPLWATLSFGVAVGVGGYIWCEIYHRTGSLKGAWLSHALADAAIMSLGYLIIT